MGKLTVRVGHAVIHGCEVSQAHSLLRLASMETPTSETDGWSEDQKTLCPAAKQTVGEPDGAVLAFPDQLKEIQRCKGVNGYLPRLPPSLANEVRSITRARERVGHIIVAGRCS